MYYSKLILAKILKFVAILNLCNINAENKKNILKNTSKADKNNDKIVDSKNIYKKENTRESKDNSNIKSTSNIDVNNEKKVIKTTVDNKENGNNKEIIRSLDKVNKLSEDLNKNGNIDDLLFLDEDDDLKELFGNDVLFLDNNNLPFLNIPISVSYYLTLIDYNLKRVDKDQRNNYFSKNILYLNSSYIVLYKFTTLHKKIWDSFLAKRPNSNSIKYIRDHFVPSVGIFFEKASYGNYYSYKIKKGSDDDSKYKDIESTVTVPIIRLGPVIKFTWTKDETNVINSSFMVSAGFQTNFYKNGCCCFHCKDTNWVNINSDFYSINKVGVNSYSKNIDNFKMNHYYVMFHLEFGFYFIKIFTRFYTPISSSNSTNMTFLDFFKMDDCSIKDGKDNDMNQNVSKKLNFDKWSMSWGLSLSI